MRIHAFATALIVLLALSFAGVARAWDGPQLWFASATAQNPGGGGIIGTGGERDHAITCAHCHTKSEGKIDLKLTFNPPLPTVGGQLTYKANQKYDVAVQLVGEHLGMSGCGQYMVHTNNFAASVENAAGQSAGVLTSDSGMSSASCSPTIADNPPGTTAVYGDCHAVVSHGADRSAWSFAWTAPAAGSGSLVLHYGAVNGNCMMDSMGDDVKIGALKLGEATAEAPRPRSSGALALLGCVPLVGAGFVAWRRRRRVV